MREKERRGGGVLTQNTGRHRQTHEPETQYWLVTLLRIFSCRRLDVVVQFCVARPISARSTSPPVILFYDFMTFYDKLLCTFIQRIGQSFIATL